MRSDIRSAYTSWSCWKTVSSCTAQGPLRQRPTSCGETPSSGASLNGEASRSITRVKPPSTPQTPRPPLAGPANLTAITFLPRVIVLAWDGLTAATGYKLEGSPDGTHWTRVALTPAGTTNFADTGLAPGTTYYYRVRASTPRGHTAYSPTITAATVPQILRMCPSHSCIRPWWIATKACSCTSIPR